METRLEARNKKDGMARMERRMRCYCNEASPQWCARDVHP